MSKLSPRKHVVTNCKISELESAH